MAGGEKLLQKTRTLPDCVRLREAVGVFLDVLEIDSTAWSFLLGKCYGGEGTEKRDFARVKRVDGPYRGSVNQKSICQQMLTANRRCLECTLQINKSVEEEMTC